MILWCISRRTSFSFRLGLFCVWVMVVFIIELVRLWMFCKSFCMKRVILGFLIGFRLSEVVVLGEFILIGGSIGSWVVMMK